MAVTVLATTEKKADQLLVGHYYELVGKNRKGLPVPPQVVLITSKPHRNSPLSREYVECVSFMNCPGLPKVAVPGQLDLWEVNVPPNSDALVELYHLGETPEDAHRSLKKKNEYPDIMKERPV